MKSDKTGKFERHGFVRDVFVHLIALSLFFFALPCLLSAQTLLHRYSFVSDGSDSVGTANGTLVQSTGAAATINNGLILPGGAGSGYFQLPSGILTNTANLTIECWANQTTQQNWAEICNFGIGGTGTYLALIADFNANNNNLGVGFRLNNNESDAVSGAPLPDNQEQYIAVTFNTNTLVGDLYTNGTLAASTTVPNINYTPGLLGGAGGTTVNTLGVDPWHDPPFQGTIYEFRIWNGVVSQRYLAASAVAGSSVVINNLTPTSVSINAGASVAVSGSEQADATCQLPQTGSANLESTRDATNWVSSDPSVLTVSSSGVITAVSSGTATVSATIAGVTGTSATITVSPVALLHRYSFVSDASDSVGGPTWDGTLVAPSGGTAATINNGLILPGGGGNTNGYLALPAGILTNTSSLTVECWVTQNVAQQWATIWDFANDGNHNFEMCPFPQRGINNLDVAITPHGGEVDTVTGSLFPSNSQQYVSFTFNSSTLQGEIYTNGLPAASQVYPDRTYIPGSIGGASGTSQNWLGNDTYGDAQFEGTIHEFRIWNGVRSAVYAAVAAAAGPTVVVTNLTPSSLSVTVTNSSMIGSETQQATATGDFVDASGVDVTAGATNWTTSNPTVLTVDSNGLITAQSGGTATVSAMVNGITATSATISVANTSPTFTKKPSDKTAVVGDTVTFSAQALGGSLNYQWSLDSNPILNATNNTLTITNVSLADAGTYSILVSNNSGSTNASAQLTIYQAILQHRYSFVSDASDSVGGPTWNGTVVAPSTNGSPVTINNGLTLPGGGGPGYSGYVTLPAGILTNTSSLTIETWVTQDNGNTWAQIWNFGNGQSQNMGLIPYPNRDNNNFEYGINPNSDEQTCVSPIHFPTNSEQYVAVVFNSTTLQGSLYDNGTLLATKTFPNSSYIPGTIGGAAGTANNVLGQDPYPDPQFQGTIHEMRIWNGAVSPLYLAISAVAGPSVVVTDTTPSSLTISVTNSTMIVGQSQSASVSGDFAQATGVSLSSFATNWSSSDQSVLTVDASGNITAVGNGNATVSASVNGLMGSSSTITVSPSTPVITQQPTASETLLEGATLRASVAANGNPPFVYRWYFNGGATPISTATNNPVLTVGNLQMADAGDYTCLVSNQYGAAPISSALTLTVVAPTVYDQALLTLGPISYWPLNESSGSTAYDVIGGHNGTYTVSSITGSSYTFAQPGPTNSFFGGSSSSTMFLSAYVDIPGGPFNLTNAMTVVAWVQLITSPNFDGVIGHGDQSWRISVNPSGQPGANDGAPPSDATSPNSIDDGNWHMLAYTYTGDTNQQDNGALYVDGQLVANNWVFTPPAGSDLDVWIGGSPDYATSRLLPAANIADCAVFDQAFTAAQVQGLYNGTAVLGPQSITITHSGSNVVLNWQHGTLLQAPTLNGPWTTNSAAASPYTVPATSGNQFFKLLVTQ